MSRSLYCAHKKHGYRNNNHQQGARSSADWCGYYRGKARLKTHFPALLLAPQLFSRKLLHAWESRIYVANTGKSKKVLKNCTAGFSNLPDLSECFTENMSCFIVHECVWKETKLTIQNPTLATAQNWTKFNHRKKCLNQKNVDGWWKILRK